MKALPDSRQIAEALPRIAGGLVKYCWLQEHLGARDVSQDVEYQQRFAGFYRVRRGANWRRLFFDILQARKTTGLSFTEALRLLKESTGRVEASFASKLVATIDPNQPVIDTVVLRNVGLRLPAPSSTNRLGQAAKLHDQLAAWYREQLATDSGRLAVRLFRAAYPNATITDTKALDLVLWQIR